MLWSQKYRPKTVSECVLPKTIKAMAEGIVKSGEIPNIIFAGRAGTGKTTLALALCEELGYEYLFLNGSGEDRGIDTVKTKILRFASSMSMDGTRKAIIYDEADNITDDAQLALRSTIEAVSSNCSFILTCNYSSRLNEALLSRCDPVDFVIPKDEVEKLQFAMFTRAKTILESENIEYDPGPVVTIVKDIFPDFRKILNRLQKLSNAGKIDSSTVKNSVAADMTVLIDQLKKKNFRGTHEWVNATPMNGSTIFSWFTNNGDKVFSDEQSWAQCFIDANDHDYRSHFVADQYINTTAFLLKIMGKCKLK